MATIGLKLALTTFGFFQTVLPRLFCNDKLYSSPSDRLFANLCILLRRINISKQRIEHLTRLRRKVSLYLFPRPCRLLELPTEIRLHIWSIICLPRNHSCNPTCPEGCREVAGALSLIQVNKSIHDEALPMLLSIAHTIDIGDKVKYETGSHHYLGSPMLVSRLDTNLSHARGMEWCIPSLRHLVLQVNIVSLGSMTPDCFDVFISHNGKEQWRSLKKLIGIWPEVREVPLESIRLDLAISETDPLQKTYRADFIRVIRNFKRTIVWAETGDGACTDPENQARSHKRSRTNKSVLLPLVRAFNQGRRNWVRDADEENNLIVRYDKQDLSTDAAKAALGKNGDDTEMLTSLSEKWSIAPSEDTSRSDNSFWPEWTNKEEKYIHDKMIPRATFNDKEWVCGECLAVFDKPRDLWAHYARGRRRIEELNIKDTLQTVRP